VAVLRPVAAWKQNSLRVIGCAGDIDPFTSHCPLEALSAGHRPGIIHWRQSCHQHRPEDCTLSVSGLPVTVPLGGSVPGKLRVLGRALIKRTTGFIKLFLGENAIKIQKQTISGNTEKVCLPVEIISSLP